ncbi:MAG: flagellar basal body P-ring protein FlgI [Planctomycetota bacterium]
MNERLFVVLMLWLCAFAHGCNLLKRQEVTSVQEAPKVPLHIDGTIRECAVLIDEGEVAVQGYGVVAGLGTDGSSEVPPRVHEYLVKTMLREKLHSWREGTERFVPRKILQGKDTAVVLIGGTIPPGAPAGARFDVFVSALRETGTCSLAGGVLWPADLHVSLAGVAVPGGPTRRWAAANGPIFVNPFIDPTDSSQAPKLCQGRIVGGGKVTRARPIRLQLLEPDYSMSQLIQRRINQRFPGSDRVAVAKNSSIVQLRIPEEYHRDYERFLRLVMHLPLRVVIGAGESHMARIVKAMQTEEANHEGLAFVLEAVGRSAVPMLSRLYVSDNPKAAFYAARTGLRLGDWKAAEVIMKFAEDDASPLQVAAIKELGDYRQLSRSIMVLRRLVDNNNELVRFAAYEALVKLRDFPMVKRIMVGDQFELDLVKTRRPDVIWVSQTGEPKIVVFGRDMKVRSPVFFRMPKDLVVINARKADKELVVFRKVPLTGKMTPPLRVDMRVSSLIRLLGSRPERDIDGKVRGLNLTYGQVVGVIYRMCEHEDIPAKFVLQPLPEAQKIRAPPDEMAEGAQEPT